MTLSRGSRWFLAFATLLLAGVAAFMWWLDTSIFDDDIEAGQPVEYTVERGATVRLVGEELAELGVVRTPVRFRLRADEEGLAGNLQPGLFELETGMEIDEVIDVLAAGPVAPPTIRFTVQEGLTVEETFERLAAQFVLHELEDFEQVVATRLEAGENVPGGLRIPTWIPEPSEAADGIEPFEGVFWPQTYDIDDQASARDVLQRMVDQLAIEMDAVPAEQREGLDDAARYDRLIIASLVERETRVDSERDTVAGVITNRLEDGMRLQIDATVVYATGGTAAGIVSLDDLEVESPYNTYRNDGLPPTPISGVGTAALRAAFDPADVPFFFYVLDAACDGSHRFAETLDEHTVNVEAFRAADRCAGESLG